MREILFRAKRIDNGEWVEGSLISLDAGSGYVYITTPYTHASTLPVKTLIGDRLYLVDPETVCQYTGLTGKHAEKIWEGDIVINNDGEVGIVKFGNYNDTCGYGDNNYGYYVEWISESGKKLKKNIAFWIENNFIEVAGNIFDNPELLEVEE